MRRILEAFSAARLPIGVERPCWLIASGDSDRVEVLRSPLVRDGHKWLEPIRWHIFENGLVLSTRKTFEDDGWMFGEVEVSVYVPSDVR